MMRRIAVPACAALCIASLHGCAPRPQSPPIEALEESKIEYLGGMIDQQQRIYDQILARCDLEYERAVAAGHPDDRVFDALILSGGGAKGAFGAGFLVGWGEVTDPEFKRPEFDLVTGVSTGSLIAPMAFLGDETSYREADLIYRNPQSDWVKERSLLNILFTLDSVFEDAGLLRTIERTIGERIPRIAAESKDHRLLLVGTTNVNQGSSQIWNLSELAGRVEAGTMTKESFCRHLLSSASIPVAFPPQYLGGNLYVDGSTTRDILYLSAFQSNDSVAKEWMSRHPGARPPKIRIWVIANTPLVVPPAAVDARDTAIIDRSLDLSVQSALLGQLKILELETRLLREVQGRDVEFRFVAMPDDWTPHSDAMFDKGDMDRMSDIGHAMGRDPKNWRVSVPDPLAPAQLRAEMERQLEAQRAAQAKQASQPTK
ncbi:MAG: patatin-like phospholipase family protein [Phycisphaerales bacterium]